MSERLVSSQVVVIVVESWVGSGRFVVFYK